MPVKSNGILFALNMSFFPSFKKRLKMGFGVLLTKTLFTLSNSLQILFPPLINLVFQG